MRVCRPGGTIGLLSWTPEGFIGQMFATMKPYAAAAAARVRSRRRCGATRSTCGALLGDRVTDVAARRADRCASTASPPPRSSATSSSAHYGPTIAVYRSIADDPDRVAALDADLAALARRFDVGGGPMDWEYLLLTARRA